ncbi:transcription factor NAI1-like [Arachis stenosperma]|uniref:transcription factor NAI1-like n=1 Tax=Arachis stenosperma TaxID=217475 RepID=UPI0025AD1267|nr:transcription factor NAI1-like [Arachis stenosperma]
MGEPCHNYWYSDMGIQDDDIFNQRYNINSSLIVDEDHIIREIMDHHHHHHHHHQPAFSSESDNSHSPTNNNQIKGGGSGNTSSFVFNNNNEHAPLLLDMKASTSTSSPRSYILSFNDSTVIATTAAATATPPPPPPPSLETYNNNGKRPYQHIEVALENQAKKVRSSSETVDHIMTERKRRRELTERFIALSATIPGLKKIDKSTILSEAISHVKQLKQQVKELEEQKKKISVESVSFIIRKSHLMNGTNNKDDEKGAINNKAATSEALLPTVEARVFKNDVLIRIHCMKQSGIMLKILRHLKSFDLSAISNSVLPFGNSTLDITVIAQIGDKFNVTMNDLVKNLRLCILESPNDDEEPHNSH